MRRYVYLAGAFLVLGVACGIGLRLFERSMAAQGSKAQSPIFQVDPNWPKPLPNRWILGSVIGVSVDSQDHVWIIHRPATLQANEIRSSWKAAPPVLEFDQAGNLLRHWGGPGQGYEWPQSEHGIYLDYKDNVWLAANGGRDSQILKFTKDGKFLLQIGKQGAKHDSNDTENLGSPANMTVDPAANEVYVADGYGNHRVIVFDADTGKYKRHWGAYGKRPDDHYFDAENAAIAAARQAARGRGRGAAPAAEDASGYDPNKPPDTQFRIVHAVRIAKDGLVYVADRTNDRIQVFRKDGTFVKEAFIAKKTLGSGSVWDIGFSIDPSQKFLYDPDGNNETIWELLRDQLEVVGSWGSGGHWAGQFYGPHSLAVDSKGNVFITETYEGKRAQKFVYKGLGTNPIASFP
jgi:DNA-binding beta-propeller fold protein YncE